MQGSARQRNPWKIENHPVESYERPGGAGYTDPLADGLKCSPREFVTCNTYTSRGLIRS
jgi:hypothetical protein